VPEAAWLHAFTVGSLGLMMLGLMTRVSQRHTGRPLFMPRAMQVACGAMFLAAVLRVTAGVGAGSTALIGLGHPAVGRAPSCLPALRCAILLIAQPAAR
jgi:uncharacterized protein involved in response to NO